MLDTLVPCPVLLVLSFPLFGCGVDSAVSTRCTLCSEEVGAIGKEWIGRDRRYTLIDRIADFTIGSD